MVGDEKAPASVRQKAAMDTQIMSGTIGGTESHSIDPALDQASGDASAERPSKRDTKTNHGASQSAIGAGVRRHWSSASFTLIHLSPFRA